MTAPTPGRPGRGELDAGARPAHRIWLARRILLALMVAAGAVRAGGLGFALLWAALTLSTGGGLLHHGRRDAHRVPGRA
jgi:hypothetical protein